MTGSSDSAARRMDLRPVPPDGRSAMLVGFGPLYYLSILPYFFRNLRMEDHSAERVRLAADRGPVVYVLHTRSHVDWLALNRVLLDRRLPLPVSTNGVDATAWMPLRQMGRALSRRLRGEPGADAMSALVQSIAASRPACVFLAPARDAALLGLEEPDPIPVLIEAQAQLGRPVQVLPVVVIWNRSPESARTEVGRFLLGTEDNPGTLGKLLSLTTRQGDALVQVGEPITLQDWTERFKDDPPARRDKALRMVLRRYLYREARVVRGPRSRPRGFVRRQVLQSREVADLVARESAAAGLSVVEVERRVAKTFDHIAARFSFPAVRIAAWLCRQIWNRVFSGVDVRPEDIDRIRAALRAGTPVLVPCHRSHLDYLLISSLLYEKDVVIPHIVAGENLSFWPLGAAFRRMGAFFVRRSFTGDRIFPVVFAGYLRELVRMEVPVEFFVEGGRSRTGKLLPPKVGVLGMLLDAAADAREGREVSFLPIYIGYEQIAEERAYARELAGAGKQKEDVTQIMRATRILRQRYGKVYLRVGEPLSARDVLGEGWGALPKPQRHEVLLATGERLLHRINREALALPTALVAVAILASPRRGVRHAELRERVERLRAFLGVVGVPEGGGIQHLDGILEEALRRFTANKMVVALEEDHGRVWSIVPERRVTLEYYKNTLMHAFAPAAFYATAIRALGADQVDRAGASKHFRLIQFLLRYEFVLDPDADAQALEARAIEGLVAYGALSFHGGDVWVVERVRVTEIANLVANFLESYLLVLRAARLARNPLVAKDLARDAMALGRTLLAVDEIARPEALNLANIENAIRAFEEDGVLRKGTDGRLADVPDLSGPYVADLTGLLGAP